MKKIILIIFALAIYNLTLSINNCSSQWVQTNGPGGGSVGCFAVSGSNIFAGSFATSPILVGGGVFLSSNNGFSWIGINNGLINHDIH